MNKSKEKILSLINILTSIILGIILLVSELSENTIYIMIMSIIIGWAIPYIVLLITGITIKYKTHIKLSLTFNIINVILCILLLILVISIYDSKMLIFIIEYIIIIIISIINSIYFIHYLKTDKSLKEKKLKKQQEKEKIKKIKKENNGAIV